MSDALRNRPVAGVIRRETPCLCVPRHRQPRVPATPPSRSQGRTDRHRNQIVPGRHAQPAACPAFRILDSPWNSVRCWWFLPCPLLPQCCLGLTRCPDEAAQLGFVLPSYFALDAGNHIHSPGGKQPDGLGDVLGIQPSCDDHGHLRTNAGHNRRSGDPIEGLPSPASRARRARIQKDCVNAMARSQITIQTVRRLQQLACLQRLDDLALSQRLPIFRHLVRRFIAVKLDPGQSGPLGNLDDLRGCLVHENTDLFDVVRQAGDDLCRLVYPDSPRTGRKNETQSIGTGSHAGLRVRQIRDCANLYPNHRAATACASSACNASPGREARISDSPIRNASNPAARRLAISSPVSIPLSATFTTPGGINSASWSDVFRSTRKVCRFRLLIPIVSQSASRARCNSVPSCTSQSTSRSNWAARRCRLTSSVCVRAATMSSTASPPWARASSNWNSSMMKSFRRQGSRVACDAISRFCSEP